MPGPINTASALGARSVLKTSFKQVHAIESIYTGGRLVFSKDESSLISTMGEDVNVMDLATGKTRQRLQGSSDTITCLAIAPSNDILFVATRNLLLQLWDLPTGTLIRSWKSHQAPVLAAAFDPTSTLLATGSADSTIRVWDAQQGFCTHHFKGHSGLVTKLIFHNKDLRLFSGGEDGSVRVWDLYDKECLAVLETHVSVVRGLDVSEDGKYLLSGGRDKIIALWDLETYTITKTVPVFEQVEACGFVPSSMITSDMGVDASQLLVFTGGDKCVVRTWDILSGSQISTQPSDNEDYESKSTSNDTIDENRVIMDMFTLPISQKLVTVTADQNIYFLNMDTLTTSSQIIGYNEEIVDVVLVGGKRLIQNPLLPPTDKSSKPIDEENDDTTPKKPTEEELDEKYVAIATNSPQIRCFDLYSPSSHLLTGHTDIVLSLDTSKDGHYLISGSKDRSIRVWKLDFDQVSGKISSTCLGIGLGHTEAVGAVAMSRKGTSFMISGSQDRTIKIWNLSILSKHTDPTPAKIPTLYTFQAHDKDINALSIAPNDKIFATASQDKTCKIWNVDSGDLLGTLKGHKRGVWSVSFSPVDKVVATSSGDKTIRIWSLKDYSCLKTFEGHLNSVLRVSFLNNGLQLLSSGSDGLIKAWNIRTTECLTTLDTHDDKVWSLAVSSSEKYILSGGADAKCLIWRDWTSEEIHLAQQEEEHKLAQETELNNLWIVGRFKEAIMIAIEMGRPYALGQLLTQVLSVSNSGSSKAESMTNSTIPKIKTALLDLPKDDLLKLLNYIKTWNTTTKTMLIAQWVLNVFLENLPVQTWMELKGAKELLEGLVPYTERHYNHAETVLMKSFLVDWTLIGMEVLEGVESMDIGEEESEDEEIDYSVALQSAFAMNGVRAVQVVEDDEYIEDGWDHEEHPRQTGGDDDAQGGYYEEEVDHDIMELDERTLISEVKEGVTATQALQLQNGVHPERMRFHG